jgi:hypothetical protein
MFWHIMMQVRPFDNSTFYLHPYLHACCDLIHALFFRALISNTDRHSHFIARDNFRQQHALRFFLFVECLR